MYILEYLIWCDMTDYSLLLGVLRCSYYTVGLLNNNIFGCGFLNPIALG
ncbi:3091_t:CDS:2 [Dentiscutata erythropus]|uniref:3091_t:CDS:1 n=1 Tax=Dentiscutata erythropus TaxID=1348616 RepID=A0A9N8VGS5_9GLOM|nr:3091_t:CDS:2 [Dentiscutata erythropus]